MQRRISTARKARLFLKVNGICWVAKGGGWPENSWGMLTVRQVQVFQYLTT